MLVSVSMKIISDEIAFSSYLTSPRPQPSVCVRAHVRIASHRSESSRAYPPSCSSAPCGPDRNENFRSWA
jgi:hypothetical protein